MRKPLWHAYEAMRMPGTITSTVFDPTLLTPAIRVKAIEHLERLVIDGGWQSAPANIAMHFAQVYKLPVARCNSRSYEWASFINVNPAMHTFVKDMRSHLERQLRNTKASTEVAAKLLDEDINTNEVEICRQNLIRLNLWVSNGNAEYTLSYLPRANDLQPLADVMASLAEQHQAQINKAVGVLLYDRPLPIVSLTSITRRSREVQFFQP